MKEQTRTENQKAHHNAMQDFYNATGNWQTGLSTIQTVAAPLVEATREAMRFQSAMADVRKVVDFDTPAQFEKMSKDILALTRTLPMAQEEIARIVAAGGQSGIARGDLLAFAESAAKMGVAFDITADQAGDMMAKWRTAFKLGQADVVKLADQINYLGNTTAASAPLISDVVTRIGPLGEIGGVASGEIAALGASMIGSGVQSEIAATGIKNLILSMTAGESATARQREAFAALGMDAEEMAKRMQKDATGAILDLFAALKALPKETQSANLSGLIGKESIGAISPLLSNLDALRGNFEKVADAQRYAGSMQAEFDARCKTAENASKLLDNAIRNLKIAIGNHFLPIVAEAANAATDIVSAFAEWAGEHETLIMLASSLAAAIAAVVMTALTVNVAASGWELFGTTLTKVAESSALETIGGQVGGLLGTLKAAPGKIGKAIIGLPKTFSAAMGKIPTIIAGAGQSIMGIPAMISGAFTAIPGIVSGAFASLAAVGWPVILGILAIVAVVALVAANFDKLKETAAIVFNHISGTVAAWAAVLQAKFDAAANKIAEVWNSITGQSLQSSELIGAIFNNLGFVLGAAFDIAAGIIGTAISVIINWVTSVAQIVGGVINIVAGLLTGDWDRAWKGAGQAVEGFAGGTLGTIKTIAGGIGDIFDTLMGKSAEVQRQAEQAKAQQDLIAKSRDAKVTADYMPDEGMMQTAHAAQQTAQATAEASAHAQTLSANVEQGGAAAQQTADYMKQLQEVMGQVPTQTQAAFSGMGEQSAAAAQAVNASMRQIPTQTQATFQQLPPMAQQGTDAMVQEFSQLATKCQPGGEAFVQAANGWGQQAYEAIANWSDQMAHVVVDKLSSAWAQISAQFSAGLNVNVTTTGGGSVSHNAEGGIYRKGAFLTTFAEDSAEAAIPLDGSGRAVSLWRRAGELLGILPKNTGDIQRSAQAAKDSAIPIPSIMDMVDALPPEISTIAEVISPPTEAEMAAAPVAYEPPSTGGDIEVNFNPQITIQGNADSGTVSQMGDMLSKLKAELMREVRREFGNMKADFEHQERRRSYAT